MTVFHGGNVWQGENPDQWLDFSANLNPEGPPEWVVEAMKAGLARARYYPDLKGVAARRGVAAHLGIPEDDFVIEPYVSDWFEAERGDYLLLCSDGLTHMVEDSEIIGILENVGSVRELCVQLLEAALAKGGLDNITILLAKCE